MKKVVLFAFQGEFMCFIHVLLNALDMNEKGYDVKIVIEGAATGIVPEMSQEGSMLYKQYTKAKELGLFAGACKACSAKMGTLDAVKEEGLALLDDMHGHPSMAAYIDDGYDVISFG